MEKGLGYLTAILVFLTTGIFLCEIIPFLNNVITTLSILFGAGLVSVGIYYLSLKPE